MARLSAVATAILMSSLLMGLTGRAVTPPSEVVDMSSAGPPMIFGSLGGSVTGSSDFTSDLNVTVDFGELSPMNPSSAVKVIVPIAIRSSGSYQMTVSVLAAPGGDANSVKLSDIGFGLQNLRGLGGKASACGSSSVIAPPFNNDPAASFTVGGTGRAAFPSSLASIVGSPVILSGPQLSKNGAIKPRGNNGYAIDAVLVVVPQYFTPGNFVLTINFSMSSTCDQCGC